MTARYKGIKKYPTSENKEFDCGKCMSVAREFLLFYLNEHLHGKK